MAEEFQAEICGGTWWSNPLTSIFFPSSVRPCSFHLNDVVDNIFNGNFYATTDQDQETSSSSSTTTNSNSNSLLLPNLLPHLTDGDVDGDGGTLFNIIGSTSPMIKNSPSHGRGSGGCRAESGFQYSLLQQAEKAVKLDSQINTPKINDVSSLVLSGNQEYFCMEKEEQNPQGLLLRGGFPNPTPTGSSPPPSSAVSSTILMMNNNNNNSSSLLLDGTFNYEHNSNNNNNPETLPFNNASSNIANNINCGSDNSPFWPDTSSAAANDIHTAGNYVNDSYSVQSQFLRPRLDDHFPALTKKKAEQVQHSGAVVKKNNVSEPAFKRPRIETPSPLPTFKVRKEKLGDRITALQQLVSPFGKTDTASVLHEAIVYIKFLHDQVSVLSTPYMKNGTCNQHQKNGYTGNMKDTEEVKQDLRSRGLCLVPISSTFPVSTENAIGADLWAPIAPTFGGSFFR